MKSSGPPSRQGSSWLRAASQEYPFGVRRALGTVVAALCGVGACHSGEVTEGPTEVVVARDLASPVRIASDGNSLFVSSGDGALRKFPDQGGAASTLLTLDAAARLLVVGLDTTSVYYVSTSNAVSDGGAPGTTTAIYRLPKTGGTSERLSDQDDVTIHAATVFHDTAFWAEESRSGEVVVKASTSPGGAAVAHLVFPTAEGLAVTGNTIFLLAGGKLVSFSRNAGGNDPGTPVSVPCFAIVADDDAAYCGASPSGPLSSIAGGATSAVVASAGVHVLALGGNEIWWSGDYAAGGASSPTSGLWRVAKQPGSIPRSVAGETADALAVDDAAIYWETSGVVKRLAK